MPRGDHDLRAAVDRLAKTLPDPLAPLARVVAYNYRWS
jgi:hypothetical protein